MTISRTRQLARKPAQKVVSGRLVPPPLMSHEDRQKLIQKPFPVITYYGQSAMIWAGVLIPGGSESTDRVMKSRKYTDDDNPGWANTMRVMEDGL